MDWCGELSGLTTWTGCDVQSTDGVFVVDEDVGIRGRQGGMVDGSVGDGEVEESCETESCCGNGGGVLDGHGCMVVEEVSWSKGGPRMGNGGGVIDAHDCMVGEELEWSKGGPCMVT